MSFTTMPPEPGPQYKPTKVLESKRAEDCLVDPREIPFNCTQDILYELASASISNPSISRVQVTSAGTVAV